MLDLIILAAAIPLGKGLSLSKLQFVPLQCGYSNTIYGAGFVCVRIKENASEVSSSEVGTFNIC